MHDAYKYDIVMIFVCGNQRTMTRKLEIEKWTLEKELGAPRQFIYSELTHPGAKMEIAIGTLKKGETIPLETHVDGDQFIRLEDGEATVMDAREVAIFSLKAGDAVIIPSDTPHVVKAGQTTGCKYYSIYAKPQHTEELRRK